MAQVNFYEQLVPDSQAALELGGVSAVTMWRWTRDEKLGFPQPVKINNRNYRKRSELEAFKQRMAETSVEREAV
jgi:predicted DNA-binding transcriptional regulator AlpA